MSQQGAKPAEPALKVVRSEGYREVYANSVQVRISVWDFFLGFGTLAQTGPDELTLDSSQGVYVSPQQAKAMQRLLAHHIEQYERTFGIIASTRCPRRTGP